VLTDFMKTNKKFEIKVGVLNGKVLDLTSASRRCLRSAVQGRPAGNSAFSDERRSDSHS
jgi:hypothetical protein